MMAHLYVIPGHGAGDPGACGNGYSEAERVRALATRIKELGGDSVTLHDFNDDAYASGALNYIDIPSDWCVVELHMDSAGAGARGGHVIIKAGFSADQYDNALANLMGNVFPGRSQLIVGRDDLANPNRAASRGINYRLVENGFISDSGDVSTFNSRMDEIAKGYLAAFGISTGQTAEEIEQERIGGLPESLKCYSDVWPDEWYVDALDKAVAEGYLKGYGDGTIGPLNAVTRGQAVCMIANAAGAEFEAPYDDVTASPYYYEAVEWAKRNEVVSSEQDSFRPDDNCTRAEFAQMLCNWMGSTDAAEPSGFSDWEDVPEWARPAMSWAVDRGVLSGNSGMLRPNDAASRAEAAQMLVNLLIL